MTDGLPTFLLVPVDRKTISVNCISVAVLEESI